MRLAIHAFAVFLVTLMMAACATAPAVSADYDRSADFATYRTFAFVDGFGTVGRVTDKQRQDRAAALEAAVAEIFKQYPFRAGG